MPGVLMPQLGGSAGIVLYTGVGTDGIPVVGTNPVRSCSRDPYPTGTAFIKDDDSIDVVTLLRMLTADGSVDRRLSSPTTQANRYAICSSFGEMRIS
jgi:hypothetical protein